MLKRFGGALAIFALASHGWAIAASASVCEERFRRAEERIQEAEAQLTLDTPGRIKGRLAEARGILQSLQAGRPKADECRSNPTGKCPPGDEGWQARWVEAVAAEVIFATTGELR